MDVVIICYVEDKTLNSVQRDFFKDVTQEKERSLVLLIKCS